MVLTNIELWAADGTSGSLPSDFDTNSLHARHIINPFDTRVVPQINSNLNHLSSNGYYGFSYINAAYNIEINSDNNNNNNNNNNNHVSSVNNNNNSMTCNLMANDVNGMDHTFETQQTQASQLNMERSARLVGHTGNIARCKKRFFVMNDDENLVPDCAGTKNKNYYGYNCEVSAKRCRYDDDFSAQYCNDFFQLPSTQIATQACLMETEEGLQQHQQQQVDVAMFENNNNIEKYEEKVNPQLETLTAQHEQHNQQQLEQEHLLQQLPPPPQQHHSYHQQQHYQDLQIDTIKCHFNYNNNCDTFALNNNTNTGKIELKKNTENVLGIHKQNLPSSIQNEHNNYDNDVANDFRVDDATLFAQLHGGCLHHHAKFNNTVSNSANYIAKKDQLNNHVQDNNYYEEF